MKVIELIQKCLKEHNNHSEVAKLAGVDRAQVSRLASTSPDSPRGVSLEKLDRIIGALRRLGYDLEEGLGGGVGTQGKEDRDRRHQEEIHQLIGSIKSDMSECMKSIEQKIDRLHFMVSA